MRFIGSPLSYRVKLQHGLVASLLCLIVAGCGFGYFQQRDPWREEAEQACLARKEVSPSIHIEQSKPIDGPGACGISYPLKVSAFMHGEVTLNTKAVLGCPMVSRTDTWLHQIVQPAAQLFFGQSVTHIRAGSYACRTRNHQSGAKLSEHSFGNALDIMSFTLSDGRDITIVKGWRGQPDEQNFLREVFVGACQHFNTVLGPGSDMFHYDHFHIDLARHDPRGLRKVCRPVLKYAPQLGDPTRVNVKSPLNAHTAITPQPDKKQAHVTPQEDHRSNNIVLDERLNNKHVDNLEDDLQRQPQDCIDIIESSQNGVIPNQEFKIINKNTQLLNDVFIQNRQYNLNSSLLPPKYVGNSQ
jgi:hypothetical protein